MARAAYLGKKAEVNVELDGLEIGVNQFGEISSNLSVDEMNSFLNKSVFDKKLKNNLSTEMSGDYEALDDDFEDEDDFDDDEDDAFDDFDDDYDDDDLEGMDFEDDDTVADDDIDDDFDDDEEDFDEEED
jgi:hypothetical protein